jgi:hypothetical protein
MRPTRELLLASAASLLVALSQWWPMFRDLHATGFGDWQMIHHNWEAAFVSIARYREWPLWDPFHCGGVPILGNPESQLYAPWFWLSFLFGTTIAIKLGLIAHMALALSGMYWLARRRYQLRVTSAALAAIVWVCGGCFVWDGVGGHATFFAFGYAPWFSLLVHTNGSPRTNLRNAAGVAAWLVLTVFEGGTYPLPFFVLWLLLELAVRALRPGQARATLTFAAVSFGLFALASAVRTVPMYLALRDYPRTVANDDALGLRDLWDMLTLRSHSWRVPGHPFVWPEYGSYIGLLSVLLALFGLRLTWRRGLRHLALGLFVFSSLLLGNLGSFAPFTLLHRLPVYDSLRVPSRFAVFVTFYLALLAAHSCDWLWRKLSRPRLTLVLGGLLVMYTLVDLARASFPLVSEWRQPALSRAQPAATYHMVSKDYLRWFASYPRLNLGTRACYIGGMNWPQSTALWDGESPQVRVLSAGGRVLNWDRTPNTVRAELILSEPARVVFNQNYGRGYESNLGRVVSHRKQVALDLPAGQHHIELRYRPPEFAASAAVSGIGLALIAWLLVARRTPS